MKSCNLWVIVIMDCRSIFHILTLEDCMDFIFIFNVCARGKCVFIIEYVVHLQIWKQIYISKR